MEIDLSNEEQRIRKSGGGRKFLLATAEGIEATFLAVLENHTVDSLMDETIKWTTNRVIRQWWLAHGKSLYSASTDLLLLCDCGGSNNARHYIFKEDLEKLAEELKIRIRIAHYPPYTSKFNPIEHRLLSHITRACQGVVFKRVDLVNDLMAKTKTATGLKVFTRILNKNFKTGRNVEDDFKNNMRIQFDVFLPQWNYIASPFNSVA